jgi:16S rRNA (cytosine967-C5)-methyltransferase
MRVEVLKRLEAVFTQKENTTQAKSTLRINLGEDRSFDLAYRLFLTVIEKSFRIDSFLEKVTSRALTTWDPIVLNAARLLVAQIVFFDHLPLHAVLNETLRATQKLGLGPQGRGFLNAIGRRHGDRFREWNDAITPQQFSLFYNIPNWVLDRWEKQWGKKGLSEMLAASQELKKFLFVRFLKSQQIQKGHDFEGVALDSPIGQSWKFPKEKSSELFSSSWFQTSGFVQNLSSQLVSCLPIRLADQVWDVCAAPGGKFLSLFSIGSLSEGNFYLSDASATRLERLEENLKRLGLTKTRFAQHDPLQSSDTRMFDWVLVDAPCSGFGAFEKYPELFLVKNELSLKEMAEQQIALLHSVSPQVKAGGRLVYCVCSTEPEETTQVIEKFCAKEKDYSLDTFSWNLFDRSGSSEKGLLLPISQNWEGFFLVVLKKKTV